MIEVRNVKKYLGLPFSEYRLLPATSFSDIKCLDKEIVFTPKMRLGSQVDDYLNSPSSFDGDVETIRPVAMALKARVNQNLFKFLERQVSFTADLVFEGMVLRWKGRPDWIIQNHIVIDTKVGEDVAKTIDFFGYPNQLSGYGLPVNTKNLIVLGVNPKTKLVKSIQIKPKYDWWERTILKHGIPEYKYYQTKNLAK